MTDTELEPETVGMKTEQTHWHWTPSRPPPAMGPLIFPGWPPLASLSFPSSSVIFYLFSHHEINFFHIFGQIELGGSHTPLFNPLTIPSSLFISGLYEYIYMDRIKKSKIDFPFLSLPPSCLPKPQRVNTWASPPPPRTLVYCLFEVRAAVTDSI